MRRKQRQAWISLTSARLAAAGWAMILTLAAMPYQVFKVFCPERKPGRLTSHPVSKFFRQAFESKNTRRFVGAGLTVLVMFSGIFSNIVAASEAVSPDATLISLPESRVLTEASLEQPLAGVIGQGFRAFHRALDILAPLDTEIRPIAPGRIIEVGFNRLGWGNMVVIEHQRGLISRYAHLKEIRVEAGQEIARGAILGTVGMTGWTTGPHLHLEIYLDGRAIDPQTVLPEFTL